MTVSLGEWHFMDESDTLMMKMNQSVSIRDSHIDHANVTEAHIGMIEETDTDEKDDNIHSICMTHDCRNGFQSHPHTNRQHHQTSSNSSPNTRHRQVVDEDDCVQVPGSHRSVRSEQLDSTAPSPTVEATFNGDQDCDSKRRRYLRENEESCSGNSSTPSSKSQIQSNNSSSSSRQLQSNSIKATPTGAIPSNNTRQSTSLSLSSKSPTISSDALVTWVNLSLGVNPLSNWFCLHHLQPQLLCVDYDGDRYVEFGSLLDAVQFTTKRDRQSVTSKWQQSLRDYRNLQPPPDNAQEFEFKYFRLPTTAPSTSLSGSLAAKNPRRNHHHHHHHHTPTVSKVMNESAFVSFIGEMSEWCATEQHRLVLHQLANNMDEARDIIFGPDINADMSEDDMKGQEKQNENENKNEKGEDMRKGVHPETSHHHRRQHSVSALIASHQDGDTADWEEKACSSSTVISVNLKHSIVSPPVSPSSVSRVSASSPASSTLSVSHKRKRKLKQSSLSPLANSAGTKRRHHDKDDNRLYKPSNDRGMLLTQESDSSPSIHLVKKSAAPLITASSRSNHLSSLQAVGNDLSQTNHTTLPTSRNLHATLSDPTMRVPLNAIPSIHHNCDESKMTPIMPDSCSTDGNSRNHHFSTFNSYPTAPDLPPASNQFLLPSSLSSFCSCFIPLPSHLSDLELLAFQIRLTAEAQLHALNMAKFQKQLEERIHFLNNYTATHAASEVTNESRSKSRRD